MSRWNLRSLALSTLGILLLGPGPAVQAAPPTGSGSSTEPRPPFDERAGSGTDFQSLGISRPVTAFEGLVLDINDRPVPNVQVKLFVDGNQVGSALTDERGTYDLRAIYDMNEDTTALLWFVAPERALMPKEVVLRESKTTLVNQLISRCVPRTAYTPGRQFRIY
ncbi:MAG TPA: carboxypeptidase-like regulatory domain-containing protein, partial [Acidobacteriota bacterium]|nr:carboxypeptidase-like regulatory domain-containing protein [Acidobacteriota bacterium]